MAMTASTSDLFFTMLLLALYSTGFMTASLRVGITDLSWYYLANMMTGFFYETYMCYMAFMAYSKRQKIKQLVIETDTVPFKKVFILQAFCWAVYGFKMLTACDTPYLLIETPSQVAFFNSTWHDCRTHPGPDIRLGWAHMGGVHAFLLAGICLFCFWTNIMNSLKQGAALLTFYNAGTLLLILRAGASLVPPVYLAFVVGSLAYDTYVLREALSWSEEVDDHKKD